MGTVTIVVHDEVYQDIHQLTDLQVENVSEFGDGTWVLTVRSAQLDDGYHGCREFVITRCPLGRIQTIRFKRDCEV